jgi:hypothetical protein
MHTPERQVVPVVHARPQAPQLALSVSRSTHVPEQLICVPVQVTPPVQVPLTQVCVEVHARPQAPQLSRSLPRVVSQPFDGTMSQLPKPALQASEQVPAPSHCAVPLTPDGQGEGRYVVPSEEHTWACVGEAQLRALGTHICGD